MKLLIYMSGADPWWTLDRQREALANVLKAADQVYCDDLDARDRQAHRVDDLADRENMLKPTSRAEPLIIAVASLAALGWDGEDVRSVLERIAERGAFLVSTEDGTLFGRGMDVDPVLIAWREAKTKSRAENAGKRGGYALKEAKAEEYRPKVMQWAHLWGHPGYAQNEVLAKMGVSRNTAIKYIGKTWERALVENRPSLRRRDLREQRRKQEKASE